MSATALPTGTVTFLLTDIEGSTSLWQNHPDAMGAAVSRHVDLIERAVRERGGVLLKAKGEGDSTFSVFAHARDAMAAATEAQRALRGETWPAGVALAVRAALHTGEAELRDGDYYGTTVNRCARLRSVAHGRQTICSRTTADLAADALPDDVAMKSLAVHRLRDLERPEEIFQVGTAGVPEEFPPLRTLDVFLHNLPAQRTSFVGRESEIRLVRDHLRQNRLVTITGVGGCGKTRLALQVAAEEIGAFSDGVFFVELAPVSDTGFIPSTIADAMSALIGSGLGAGAGRTVRSDLLDALARRNALVVLDNCEHLLEGCAALADDLIERCPGVRLLATSREALGLPGEQTHTLPSLALPAGDAADGSEAVRLFCERARAVREDFSLSSENAPAVNEICRRLDGVPLAIELAAARIGHLSPQQIAKRLDDRFALLTGGRRRVQRQQTLAAALDWSHDLLSEEERVLLRRLAVFSGSFSLTAVEAVCGKRALDPLASLVGKSMVVTEDGAELRYRLLETVRMYAEEKLVAAGESAEMRSRHRDHFLAWVEAFPDDDGVWPDSPVTEEVTNLRAALVWSEQQGRADLVGRLASLMYPAWNTRDVHEGVRWLSFGVQAAADMEPKTAVRVLSARAYVALAAIESGFDFDAVLRRAIQLAGDTPGFWQSVASGLYAYLRILSARPGESVAEEIEEHGRRALRLATGPAARWLALFWLGCGLTGVGKTDRAIAVFARALHEPGLSRYEMWIPFAATELSILYHVAGDHRRALETAQEGQRHPMSAHWRLWDLYCSLGFPLALAASGRQDEALEFVREKIRANGDWFMPGHLAATVVILGVLAAMRGDMERAAVLLGSAAAAIARGEGRGGAEELLCAHYVQRVDAALGMRSQQLRSDGAAMPLTDALGRVCA